MSGISQHEVRAELDRLLLGVPLGTDRETLEARSHALREKARWERGMCDNHATANRLHEEADVYDLAAQERFPREGDGIAATMSARIAHEMSAKHWTCIRCGTVERLTYYPDCCSFCGGAMESDDGRTSSGVSDPEIPFEVYHGAAEGDPASTIELWHLGAPLGPTSRQVLEDLMLQNRQEQLLALFAEAA